MIKLVRFFTFYVFLDFYTHKNKCMKVRSKTKTMHIKNCMMHKCMRTKHLMHGESNKDSKNKIKDQNSISSIIRTLPHPNGTSLWSECLMRSEMRVGRMRTGDTHSQEGDSIKDLFQQHAIFTKIWFYFLSTTSKMFKYLFFF